MPMPERIASIGKLEPGGPRRSRAHSRREASRTGDDRCAAPGRCRSRASRPNPRSRWREASSHQRARSASSRTVSPGQRLSRVRSIAGEKLLRARPARLDRQVARANREQATPGRWRPLASVARTVQRSARATTSSSRSDGIAWRSVARCPGASSCAGEANNRSISRVSSEAAVGSSRMSRAAVPAAMPRQWRQAGARRNSIDRRGRQDRGRELKFGERGALLAHGRAVDGRNAKRCLPHRRIVEGDDLGDRQGRDQTQLLRGNGGNARRDGVVGGC